jgi:hypothetical protein
MIRAATTRVTYVREPAFVRVGVAVVIHPLAGVFQPVRQVLAHLGHPAERVVRVFDALRLLVRLRKQRAVRVVGRRFRDGRDVSPIRPAYPVFTGTACFAAERAVSPASPPGRFGTSIRALVPWSPFRYSARYLRI